VQVHLDNKDRETVIKGFGGRFQTLVRLLLCIGYFNFFTVGLYKCSVTENTSMDVMATRAPQNKSPNNNLTLLSAEAIQQ
jgi:hypothetical protein